MQQWKCNKQEIKFSAFASTLLCTRMYIVGVSVYFFFILVGLLSPSLLTSYNFIICLKYYIGDDLHVIG